MSFLTRMFAKLSLVEEHSDKCSKQVLLTEDIESVRKNYPNISDEDFYRLIALDPTFVKDRNSLGTYGKWILNLFSKGLIYNEGHITDALQRFDSVKKQLKNKDINAFKSVEDLDSYMNDEENYTELSHRQKVRQNQNRRKNSDLGREADLVFETDNWEVWIPKTYGASCKLGQGTSWCTASTESSYYYDHYSKEGPLYINIHKLIPNEKYQFHFESEQFMNNEDRGIDIFQFLFEEHKELVSFYNKIICKWLELEEGTDLFEYTQESFDADDIEYMLSSGTHGDVRGDTAAKLICHPEDLYGEWDFSYNEVSEDLLRCISDDNRNRIRSLIGSIELEDITDNAEVYSIIRNAAEVACEDATIAQAHQDAVRALEKSVSDIGRGEWHRNEQEFVVTYIPYHVLREYYSSVSQYFNNVLKDSIAQIIEDNYRLFEPQYGWNEFNTTTFNNYLSDNL